MKRNVSSKLLLTTLLMLCFSASAVFAQKFAVIVTDPHLGKMGEYWNTDRYNYERAYFQYHGYRVFEMEATESNLLQAITDPNVTAITYIGHGGATTLNGTTDPTLGDYTAEQWRQSFYNERYKQFRRQNYSKEDARKKAKEQAQNFGKERVVNYSCNSLINHDIADQFVKPGGTYYGSKKLYNPKAVYESVGYIYTLLSGNDTDSQFFLEEYKVPQNSFAAEVEKLTSPEYLDQFRFDEKDDATNNGNSSSECMKRELRKPLFKRNTGKCMNWSKPIGQ